jgi:hypothetical protein
MKDLLLWMRGALLGLLSALFHLCIYSAALFGLYAGVNLGVDLNKEKCAAITANTSICLIGHDLPAPTDPPPVDAHATTL